MANNDEYTAVIYVHGIGIPRRYEEISRLADSLDAAMQAMPSSVARGLRRQRLEYEVSRVDSVDDFAYIAFEHIINGSNGRPVNVGHFRLYDAYWSSSAGGRISSIRILLWLLSLVIKPLSVLAKPWRAFQNLKLATLNNLHEARSLSPHHVRQLKSLYAQFENWPSRRAFPRGTLKDFKKYVISKNKNYKFKNIYIDLIDEWHRQFVIIEAKRFLYLMALAGCFLAIFLIPAHFFIIGVMQFMGLDSLSYSVSLPVHEEWGLLSHILFSLLALLPIILVLRIVQSHIKDLYLWAINSEKDPDFINRTGIKRSTEEAISQVLRDKNCVRVIIIGHSLGSAIALDVLKKLGQRFLARHSEKQSKEDEVPISKITDLITLGSPIDKIDYYFETQFSRHHRYNRVSDTMRGGVGFPPFRLGEETNISWLNIYDPVDVISGPVFSPIGSFIGDYKLENLRIRTSDTFNPLCAHSGYLESDSVLPHIVTRIFFVP